MKKFLLILSLIASISASVLAQSPMVRNLRRDEYMAGKQNWSITQDKNDWTYFANNRGLLVYNGDSWQLYPIINYTDVRSVLYDQRDNRIYAGAYNEFGFYSTIPFGRTLQYHSIKSCMKNKEFSCTEVWNIMEQGNKVVFQCDHDVIIYDRITERTSTYQFNDKIEKSAIVGGRLYISSSTKGVWVFDWKKFVHLRGSEALSGKKVCAILPFNGAILFVTSLDGIYRFANGQFDIFNLDISNYLENNQIFCADIRNNKIAFGTVRAGLVIKDLNTGENTFVNSLSGLQNNTVLSMKFDSRNNLWLGLDNGIDYVMSGIPIYDLFSYNNQYGSGYASLLFGSTLYLGTNQGLYTMPFTSGERLSQPSLFSRVLGQIWSLNLIDGKVFCGCDLGAYIIDGGQASQIKEVNGTWRFIELKKNPGYILGCCYKGFFLMKNLGGAWRFYGFVSGFDVSGGDFKEDANGDIWFAHWQKGIYRLMINTEQHRFVNVESYGEQNGLGHRENNLTCKIGEEVFFSTTIGFRKFNPKTKYIDNYKHINDVLGYRPNSVKLEEMPNGDLWLMSTNYISLAHYLQSGKYAVDSTTYRSLQTKIIPGFEDISLIGPNQYLLGTEDGFSIINTSKKLVQKQTLLQISSVYSINNQIDSLIYSQNQKDKKNKTIDIPYSLNSLRIEFVLPEFQEKNAVEYSYYLEGDEGQSGKYTTETHKEYSNLSQGKYTFHLRSHNKVNGRYEETSFSFRILPPWYESLWAIIFYVALVISAFFYSKRYIKEHYKQVAIRIKQEKEKQLKEQEERFQIENDMKEKEIVAAKNQQLELNLKHKSQELANSTMNLIRKNEALLGINESINDISSEDCNAVARRKLKQIQRDIQDNIKHDDDWKVFEANFDIVYDDYLKKLSLRFPNINANEKRLCAYLKMDLSSKDIAPLLNTSIRSIETARYRLRHKLGLGRDDNLAEFLQNLA
ncbi:MAG: hypothetical protein LKF31_02625 [Muribaculaceae bacterium]|jgi:DNA-binding CsgD family transcriptional regulator|nr:hypothetical protein [Muribaculaceae bacterium]